jgi:excisionase family DNA binding protein
MASVNGHRVPALLDGDDLLTLQEAADRCTVNYETFRRWVAKGVLRYTIVGPYSTMRVRRRDVENLIRDGDE